MIVHWCDIEKILTLALAVLVTSHQIPAGYVPTTVPFRNPKAALQRSILTKSFTAYNSRVLVLYLSRWANEKSLADGQTSKPDALAESPPIARPGCLERIQKAQVEQD